MEVASAGLAVPTGSTIGNGLGIAAPPHLIPPPPQPAGLTSHAPTSFVHHHPAVSSADVNAHISMLLQITGLGGAGAAGAAPSGHLSPAVVASVDPLSILTRGYKRKHSSIDSAVSSTLMTPIEGLGTPVDDVGSPSCFWGTATNAAQQTGALVMQGMATSPLAGQNRRNKTFSAEMSDLFVHEVIRRKETLVENNTNREVDFNRQKKQAWHEVFEAVRGAFPNFSCTVEGMKTHWRYRKRRVRDAAPYMKKFREQGVGAEAIGERMNDADWAIYDILMGTGTPGGRSGSRSVQDPESDLDDKDASLTPPQKYCRIEEIKEENSQPFPISPVSIAASGEDSNSGLGTTASLALQLQQYSASARPPLNLNGLLLSGSGGSLVMPPASSTMGTPTTTITSIGSGGAFQPHHPTVAAAAAQVHALQHAARQLHGLPQMLTPQPLLIPPSLLNDAEIAEKHRVLLDKQIAACDAHIAACTALRAAVPDLLVWMQGVNAVLAACPQLASPADSAASTVSSAASTEASSVPVSGLAHGH